MKFGGYVSYTVGGYKCHTFGAAEVTSAIAQAASELDMPQAISLRAGRKGLRRTMLKGPAGQIVVYSAFVGLFEPKVNRLGSFLAIGVAVGPGIGWASANVGSCLCGLLDDLARRVSDGNRFASELTVEILNTYLRENSTIFEEMQAGFAPVDYVRGSRSDRGQIYLSDKGIWKTSVFNQVCAFLPPEEDFFLFEHSARSEVQSTNNDFQISVWPMPVVQEKSQAETWPSMPNKNQQPRQTQLPQSSGLREKAGELSASEVAQALKRLEEGARRDSGRISEIEELLVARRNLHVVALVVVILLLMTVAFLSYQWDSTTNRKISETGEKLRIEVGRQLAEAAKKIEQSAGESSRRVREPEFDMPLDQGAVVLPKDMNYKEISSMYCPNYRAVNFSRELGGLNPGAIDSRGVIERGTRVALPVGCAESLRK